MGLGGCVGEELHRKEPNTPKRPILTKGDEENRPKKVRFGMSQVI